MEKFHTLEVGVFNVLAASLYRFSSDYISFYVHIDWVLLFFVLVCHLSLLHIKFACNGKLALVWKRRNGVFQSPAALSALGRWCDRATRRIDSISEFDLCLCKLETRDACTLSLAETSALGHLHTIFCVASHNSINFTT